nr:immunoglobulin heavy chain junction region [Macaca mulatta]
CTREDVVGPTSTFHYW